MPAVGFSENINFAIVMICIIIAICAPIVSILFKMKHAQLMSIASFAAALVVLLFQSFDFVKAILENDVSLILDVYVFMPKIYIYFVLFLIIINGTSLLIYFKRKH